jgi:hypothetical protein
MQIQISIGMKSSTQVRNEVKTQELWSRGRSQWRLGGSKEKWSQIRITLKRSRIRIRIFHIPVNS